MMGPGADLDILVSTRVMNQTDESKGLKSYSSNIKDAWEVMEAMGITLIPIEGGSWFAMVGPGEGWKSPADFLECLGSGDFVRAGAAVTESAPLSICLAALSAVEKRKFN